MNPSHEHYHPLEINGQQVIEDDDRPFCRLCGRDYKPAVIDVSTDRCAVTRCDRVAIADAFIYPTYFGVTINAPTIRVRICAKHLEGPQ